MGGVGSGRSPDPRREQFARFACTHRNEMSSAQIGRRLGISRTQVQRLQAEFKDHVWPKEPQRRHKRGERCACGLLLPCAGCPSIYGYANERRPVL